MSTYSTLRIDTLCQEEKVVGDTPLPMMLWKWSDVPRVGICKQLFTGKNFLQEKSFVFGFFAGKRSLQEVPFVLSL